jgi:hypothetical protein
MVQDALKVIRKAMPKNGPQILNKLMAKNSEKAGVSKRLQKQVEATMARWGGQSGLGKEAVRRALVCAARTSAGPRASKIGAARRLASNRNQGGRH